MSDYMKRAVNETARLRTALLLSTTSVVYNDDDDDSKKKDDDMRKDEKLDKLLAGIDSIGGRLDDMKTRMDRMDARMDAYEKDDDKEEKKDAHEEEVKGEKILPDKKKDDDKEEDEKAKEVVADKKKAKKDDAKKDEPSEREEMAEKIKGEKAKEKKDDDDDDSKKKDARSDSVVSKADLDEIRKLIPRQMTDEEYGHFSKVQERADGVFMAFGDSAPRPMQGEGLIDYRKRLLAKLQTHSPTWKDINVRALPDEATLAIAEAQVYSDAARAAESPASLPEGKLLERIKIDQSGRRISTFVGRHSFVRQFKRPARKLRPNPNGTVFNTDFRGR